MTDRDKLIEVIQQWYAINGATGKTEDLADEILSRLEIDEVEMRAIMRGCITFSDMNTKREDAFYLYQEGNLSKGKLIELIAHALSTADIIKVKEGV